MNCLDCGKKLPARIPGKAGRPRILCEPCGWAREDKRLAARYQAKKNPANGNAGSFLLAEAT